MILETRWGMVQTKYWSTVKRRVRGMVEAEAGGKAASINAPPNANLVKAAKKRKLGSSGRDPAAQPPIQPQLRCPECGSAKIWRDGIRETAFGSVQRFLCRNCGYRFSDPRSKQAQTFFNGSAMSEHVEGIHTQKLKGGSAIFSKRQVCDLLTGESKNLAEVETRNQERAAGATLQTVDKAAAKGLLLQYELWLQKQGYGEKSRYVDCIRMLINSGANLCDPEDVKAVVAKKKWKNGTKMQVCYAYDALAKMLKITWQKPTYRQEETLPFIPEEKELDALICGTHNKRLAAYLQTLKETFADPGEALRLRWIDVSENVVTINRPIRNHNPRQIRVSNKLIAMLNSLPKSSELIFPTTYNNIVLCFNKMRRKTAQTQQNPRILKISFNTFRHWGATMLYHQTRDILLVKKLLGHKKIDNTMKYTQLIEFKDNEYDVATATTIDEAKQILSVGFNYVTEKDGIMLFRKPKRFNS